MTSSCGRFVLAYNGEIYNHKDLRLELEAANASPRWKGHSDTEVLLAALAYWGVEKTLRRVNGMFAFALWDRHSKILHLARDRIGEKPLYYGWSNGVFLFGSQLKALAAHPNWEGQVDRRALTFYLRFGYIPAPHSIWTGITKLQPAHYIAIRGGSVTAGQPQCYWDFDVVARRGADLQGDADELTNVIEAALAKAVRMRMEADVPLGAFLSGGIDLSTIVALMQSQSSRPVRTFSIGFHEDGFDEAIVARDVATHLRTDHTEFYVTAADALAVVPKLPNIWDEPFGDASQIPTYLVSELARRHVTVSLSGDGGDELFGGYNRYVQSPSIWNRASKLPQGLRETFARSILNHKVSHAIGALNQRLPHRYRLPAIEFRLPTLAAILEAKGPRDLYRDIISNCHCPSAIVRDGGEPRTALDNSLEDTGNIPTQMMYWDTITYLPDDILAKVDRATMAVGLEARVPFLDHEVVELAWRLPLALKIRRGQGKWILRKVLAKHVPPALTNRPKMGFGVPIGSWLRGPLRDWAEDLLNERRLMAEGFFEPSIVRDLWSEHSNGSRYRHVELWDILMFQAWWQEQTKSTGMWSQNTGDKTSLVGHRT